MAEPLRKHSELVMTEGEYRNYKYYRLSDEFIAKTIGVNRNTLHLWKEREGITYGIPKHDEVLWNGNKELPKLTVEFYVKCKALKFSDRDIAILVGKTVNAIYQFKSSRKLQIQTQEEKHEDFDTLLMFRM